MRDTHPAQRASRSVRSGAGPDLFVVAGATGLVVAAVLVGQWLLERGVPIHAAAAPLFAWWQPHVGPGTVAAVLVAALVVGCGPQLAGWLAWRSLLAVSYLGALAWTLSLALVDGWQRGVVARLTPRTEYLREVPGVTDIPAMLATFTDRILSLQPGSWTTHVAGHPPGALLVFVGLHRVGLSGGAPAALLCVVVGASACVAVAVALRALGAESLARSALPFGVLLPGAVWIGVSADGLFAGVVAWGVALLAVAASRPRSDGPAIAAAMGGGLLLGAGLYLSYGLVLAGLLPLAVLVCTRRPVPLLLAGTGVVAVVGIFTAAGFWWLDGYQKVTMRYYEPGEWGLERPYGYWVWANLAALVIVLGPAALAGLRRAAAGWRRCPLRPLVLLCGAALLAVLLADASGLSKAEVERIWLPFAVWLVAAAGLLPQRQLRWWLAGQAVVALVVNHLLLTGW
ncbi:MAG: hypothetical protein ACRDRV_21565 [Pseudonocardiaceae bacterium]